MALLFVSGVHYKVIQVNGQRLVGPPDVFVGNEPPEKCELRLMMKISGENRGFCYVTYICERDALNAIRNLNKVMVYGNRLRVSLSKNRRHLIFGGINPNVPDDVILQGLLAYVQPSKVNIFTKFNGKCALLEFANHRDAAMAKRAFGVHARKFGPGIFIRWYD
ncbi:probable RNA-binding protein 46 isoform X2 [Lutzomyia longipalpis]|uniref:probable RNA-binding protein 46 isoform X2 n=1 Tax=Lutzomyia longipalpis TaxID=7200 RepID=UPI002483D0A0|nr:probable RNA-binding protein 46 isoform X2 [Lutzomyia longipalpis]